MSSGVALPSGTCNHLVPCGGCKGEIGRGDTRSEAGVEIGQTANSMVVMASPVNQSTARGITRSLIERPRACFWARRGGRPPSSWLNPGGRYSPPPAPTPSSRLHPGDGGYPSILLVNSSKDCPSGPPHSRARSSPQSRPASHTQKTHRGKGKLATGLPVRFEALCIGAPTTSRPTPAWVQSPFGGGAEVGRGRRWAHAEGNPETP